MLLRFLRFLKKYLRYLHAVNFDMFSILRTIVPWNLRPVASATLMPDDAELTWFLGGKKDKFPRFLSYTYICFVICLVQHFFELYIHKFGIKMFRTMFSKGFMVHFLDLDLLSLSTMFWAWFNISEPENCIKNSRKRCCWASLDFSSNSWDISMLSISTYLGH